jgi:hypothetical protein
MRTFAQKQNQPQKPVSSSLARTNAAKPGPHHRADPILRLQRAIGKSDPALAVSRPGDRYRIGEAVERELAWLFDEQGVPPSLARVIERLEGGAFEVAHSSKSEAVGVQIAQAIYEGLG